MESGGCVLFVESNMRFPLRFQLENLTRPKDPFEGHSLFPTRMRQAPRHIWPYPVSERIWPGPLPERIPWISGVLAAEGAEVVSAAPNDRWWRRWCKKHGPCVSEHQSTIKSTSPRASSQLNRELSSLSSGHLIRS